MGLGPGGGVPAVNGSCEVKFWIEMSRFVVPLRTTACDLSSGAQQASSSRCELQVDRHSSPVRGAAAWLRVMTERGRGKRRPESSENFRWHLVHFLGGNGMDLNRPPR
jgi:hypothetical protein